MEWEHYREAVQEEDWQEALRLLKQDDDLPRDELYYQMGWIYVQCGDLQKALHQFYQAVSAGRDDGEINYQIGSILNMQSQCRNAVMFLEEAIHKGKDDEVTNSELGLALKRIGKTQQANRTLKKAIQMYRSHMQNHHTDLDMISRIAYLYGEMGEWRSQLEYLQMARDAGRDDLWLKLSSAEACMKLKEYHAAFDEYRDAARAGDMNAQFQLAQMYRKGIGTDKNSGKALIWLERAYASNHPKAAEELSMMYFYGEGIPADKQMAFTWLERSRESSDPNMLCEIGKQFYQGLGIDRNLATAILYFEQAAALDQPEAQYYLARMYDEGEGFVQDHERALYWYRRAAENGNRIAAQILSTR
ncbi:MAG: SEL1-like repeat protein [Erysipelotrichaceae bacterium]|nr:SEL1-like repeat protein [Erysipelotrichaceae bacterium]